jgi:hypothetical protein
MTDRVFDLDEVETAFRNCTGYEWHMAEPRGRVVVYMQNRRDNPDPAEAPTYAERSPR